MSKSMTRRIRDGIGGNIITLVAVLVLVVIASLSLFAPLIAPHDPDAQNLMLRLKPPAWSPEAAPGFLLGTDELGRDILSRVIYGSRVSILVGVTATLLSGMLGSIVGLLAGYLGRGTDQVLMRLADIQLAIPSLLLALAIIAALGPGLGRVIVVLGITGWVTYARVVRAEVLTLRSREFVAAAEAIGVSRLKIMSRHLLPNVVPSIATVGTVQIAAVIILEASLSYLGLGVPPSIPTWGGMLREGQLHLANAWWIAALPGFAIMLTTLSINIVGDLLRDVSDPKTYIP
jgi:peptide/nickel transport system permease protein